MKKTQQFVKKLFFVFFVTNSIFLIGCSKTSSEESDSSSITILPPTQTASPLPTPSILPQTTTPKATLALEESVELSSEDAKSLILERLDITKYTVDLINSNLVINEKNYYSFLVSEGNTVFEPALIVDKKTGEIFCYDSMGTISDYSEFPLYNESLDVACDWNGLFYCYNSAGGIHSSLLLGQGDSHSFQFTLSVKDGFEEINITGIASIQGNSASYTNEDGLTLHFVMSEHAVAVTEERTSSTVTQFAGVYYLSTEEVPAVTTLSSEKAIELLSTLSKEQAKLPNEITDYTLIADDLTITIKDSICYSISVYTDLSERLSLMNTYYVAVDGSKIFMFDTKIVQDIEIWSAD